MCVGEVFSVDSAYLMLAEGKKGEEEEEEEEEGKKEEEGDLAEKGARTGRSPAASCLLACDRPRARPRVCDECARVCVSVIQSPPAVGVSYCFPTAATLKRTGHQMRVPQILFHVDVLEQTDGAH